VSLVIEDSRVTHLDPSDGQLLDLVAAGDHGAFAALAERHRDLVRRQTQRIVRDDAAAEDLVQETLLRVWLRAGQWNGDGSATAWILRIATNLALNHLRSRQRHPEALLPEPVGEDEECDFGPSADDELLRAERSAVLRRLVDALPEEKREVMRLVYDAGLEVQDAADALGIPEGTAKSRLHHARKRVARDWEELMDG